MDELPVDFYLDLKDDGNYRFYNDEEQFTESIIEALTKAMGDAATEDQVRELVENQESLKDMVISQEGSYKVDGDKITLDAELGNPEEAVIENDGSLSMTIESEDYTGDLHFVKQ